MATGEAFQPIPGTEKQTLKPNAIGFVGGLVIGLASTAPAYSLAAVIGSLVVVVALQTPAALLASFIPMFLIAGAFFYMGTSSSRRPGRSRTSRSRTPARRSSASGLRS